MLYEGMFDMLVVSYTFYHFIDIIFIFCYLNSEREKLRVNDVCWFSAQIPAEAKVETCWSHESSDFFFLIFLDMT